MNIYSDPVTFLWCGLGGGESVGECHWGDREQEPAAAYADHAVPDTADAEH